MVFTHQWLDNFGWENTIYLPSDFVSVEPLSGEGPDAIFLAVNEKGAKTILKGSNDIARLFWEEKKAQWPHADVTYKLRRL